MRWPHLHQPGRAAPRALASPRASAMTFRLCTLPRNAVALLSLAGTLAVSAETVSSASTCGLPDFAATALARINEARARGADCGSGGRFGPAPPVAWSDKLAQAADAHAREMVARDVLSHAGANGRMVDDRVDAAGYDWASVAENIAGGYASIDAVVAGWVKSPSHCRNLMSPTLSDAGLACVPGRAASTYPNYWALNLGRQR